MELVLHLASEYNMIGSMLAINNVTKEDEGFYHCIANGMEAGQTIGVRQLSVERKSHVYR